MNDIQNNSLFTELTPEEESSVSGGSITITGSLTGGTIVSISNVNTFSSSSNLSKEYFALASSEFARKYFPSWMWPAADNFWK